MSAEKKSERKIKVDTANLFGAKTIDIKVGTKVGTKRIKAAGETARS